MIILERLISNVKVQLIKKQNGSFKVVVEEITGFRLSDKIFKDEDEAMEKFYHQVVNVKKLRC